MIASIYNLIRKIVSYNEPNSGDEFYWLDKVFALFGYEG